MKNLVTLLITLLLLSGSSYLLGEAARPLTRFTVITTTDTSELGLARPLQEALAKLADSTKLFQTSTAAYSLPGFTPKDVSFGFKRVGANILSFVYMEKSRVSIFLFDSSRPTEFIVSSRLISNPPGGKLSSPYIEVQFKEAFQEVITKFVKKDFQALPGTKVDSHQLSLAEQQETKRKSDEAKKLFRELATLEYRPVYLGANVGMSRFSSGAMLASTVDFGGYFGYRPTPSVGLEVGVDIFSYAFLHADARYHIPWADKYVGLSVSGGLARCMGHLSDNQGFGSTEQIAVGATGYGPGFAVEIPLLGANLRGEIRYYFGSSPLLVGTYGILYSL